MLQQPQIGASGCRLRPCNMWGSAPVLRRPRSRVALATETDQMVVSTGVCGSRAKIGIRPTSARGVRSTIRWSRWAPTQAAKAGASGYRNPPGTTWTTAGAAMQTRHWSKQPSQIAAVQRSLQARCCQRCAIHVIWGCKGQTEREREQESNRDI